MFLGSYLLNTILYGMSITRLHEYFNLRGLLRAANPVLLSMTRTAPMPLDREREYATGGTEHVILATMGAELPRCHG
jgi:hypothetical protein